MQSKKNSLTIPGAHGFVVFTLQKLIRRWFESQDWITKLPYETKCSNMETQNTHTHTHPKIIEAPPPPKGPTSCPKLFSVTGAPL